MTKNPSHRDAIRILMKKFEQTGSVLNIDPLGRSILVTDQSMKDEVPSILNKEPQTSHRRINSEFNI